MLDQLLLILMIIEIFYTVQVSFREHVLVPEPCVLVALGILGRDARVLRPGRVPGNTLRRKTDQATGLA